jgi:glycosyltransferase involved in cell wall biosynthesis
MPRRPEISILVSTYQRPKHLRRALLSIAMQREVDGKMEVIVTDDGSADETREVVRAYAQSVDFPVRFTTHPHTAFQLARCRNEGVAASEAPYLLFLDGDCVLPPDHVAIHLEQRRPGHVMAGYFARLDKTTSSRLDEQVIRSGEFVHWAPTRELRQLRAMARKAQLYTWLRHSTKPKMSGNNVGIWRADYERVNGYDENFEGWGCEDDDLRLRLRRTGVRIHSILPWTFTYHIWHPYDVTRPAVWRQGRNVAYLNRQGAIVRCCNGLVKRRLEDIRLRIVGDPPTALARLIPWSKLAVVSTDPSPEVEVVFSPGTGRFSGKAECNLLVALNDSLESRRLARQAHVLVADYDLVAPQAQHAFPLCELKEALSSIVAPYSHVLKAKTPINRAIADPMVLPMVKRRVAPDQEVPKASAMHLGYLRADAA